MWYTIKRKFGTKAVLLKYSDTECCLRADGDVVLYKTFFQRLDSRLRRNDREGTTTALPS